MKKIVITLVLVMLSGAAFCQTKPDKKARKRDTIKVYDKADRQLLVINFFKLFKEETNGDITALYPVKIGYYTIDKDGNFPANRSLDGVMLRDIKGKNLLIDTVKGVVIYKGVYN
ncbi:hypothetical protein KXQ82_18885 [Mucilaginibacter sp. HMF5004]|uniref:hypothetical protein n=1 Tax=Mucilaginibacter rivuli TaxID=2857527 RepID=UPI001C5E2DB4|nr:hypothetical protein [Mucilaginibacter rivuli]MBW4891799.1 hypothetical protein [Mucilaginibacter rivuli]